MSPLSRAERTARDRADRRWSSLVRKRAGYQCERCGSRDQVEAAHIISRNFHATRCDLDNGRALCRDCHRGVDAQDWDGATWEWDDLIGVNELDRLRGLAMGWKRPRGWWQDEATRLAGIVDARPVMNIGAGRG